MAEIIVEGLSKDFTYSKKETGLKNSIKSLFHTETHVKHAVKNISFQLEKGEIVGFLGPNGAGKTTTLKMLSGIMHPSQGKVSVLGYTPWERKNIFKRQISIVLGQKNQLWWDLPANESLFLNKCIYKIEDKRYNSLIDELSELLKVKDLLGIQVRNLSLGERMKMELIAALIHSPKVLFLDEPTIGLDIVAQKTIREFLKEYNRKEKTTVLLTSHYMNDIEDLCQRAIVINNGDLVYDGHIKEINERMNNKKIFQFQFEDAVDRSEMEKLGTIVEFNPYSVTLEVNRNETQKISSYILNKYLVKDYNLKDIPLEDSISLLYQGKRETV